MSRRSSRRFDEKGIDGLAGVSVLSRLSSARGAPAPRNSRASGITWLLHIRPAIPWPLADVGRPSSIRHSISVKKPFLDITQSQLSVHPKLGTSDHCREAYDADPWMLHRCNPPSLAREPRIVTMITSRRHCSIIRSPESRLIKKAKATSTP